MTDLTPLIDEYLSNWEYIHQIRIEGYKWRGFSQFKQEFDLSKSGQEFADMLKRSTDKAGNLLNDGHFMARDTLIRNALVTPEKVKALFVNLYDEDESLEQRINDFKKLFAKLNKENFSVYGIKTSPAQSHQSTRAISVYLSFRYPDRYFLYFKKMYRLFAEKVGYPYIERANDVAKLLEYYTMCREVKALLESHQNLIDYYHNHIKYEDNFDLPNHHLLTQDFIYNIAFHLAKDFKSSKPEFQTVENVDVASLKIRKVKPNLKGGSPIDYTREAIRNKSIGDAGELFVLEHEKQILIEAGRSDLAEKVEHTAAKRDGAGYDIKSFDVEGNAKYIEVKATKGKCDTTFYISESERLFSEKNSNFYLYRVYNYNEQTRTGDIMIIQGNITNICTPINYRVDLVMNK